jgi:hypothetical protein
VSATYISRVFTHSLAAKTFQLMLKGLVPTSDQMILISAMKTIRVAICASYSIFIKTRECVRKGIRCFGEVFILTIIVTDPIEHVPLTL